MYACLARGLSFKIGQGNVLTLSPPLVITRGRARRGVRHHRRRARRSGGDGPVLTRWRRTRRSSFPSAPAARERRRGRRGALARRHAGRARRRPPARGLERAAQVGAAAATRCSTPRRSSPGPRVCGLAGAAVRAAARSARLAVRGRVDAHPLRLLRDAGAGLPHRRPVVRLPADARHRAAAGHAARHRVPARTGRAPQVVARHPAHLRSASSASPSRAAGATPPAAACWALANAAIIAVYTLVDGTGARASGNALRYVAWLTFLEGMPFLGWISRAARRAGASAYLRARLASRPARRRLQRRRLRHRALGDDARAGRRRRRAARDVGAVRRADRRAVAEGRLRPARGWPAPRASSLGVAALKL